MSDRTHTSDGARDLPDERLWEQCRWEAFRASGPGGQKRNKTSSAIRVTYEPTGLSAIANESRSQSENRQRAFRRLRHRMALELRRPIDVASFRPPGWFVGLLAFQRLKLSPRNPQYLQTVGLVLDVLAATEGAVSDAATLLGISTANLVHFLTADEKLWAHTNQMRQARGLRPLVQTRG